MKIATFNVNGIKTRLPNLLQWLQREQPDVSWLKDALPQPESRECDLPTPLCALWFTLSARAQGWDKLRKVV